MTKLPTDRDRNPVFQNEKWQITNAIIKYITTDFIECFDSNFVCSLVCYAKNDSHVGNVITNFEAPLKLFLYSIFFYLLPKLSIQSLSDEVFLERNISLKLKLCFGCHVNFQTYIFLVCFSGIDTIRPHEKRKYFQLDSEKT